MLGLAVGIGGLAYVGFEYMRRRAASYLTAVPEPNTAPHGQVSELRVQVHNSGPSTIRFGVQAATFDPSAGVVVGHWFTSPQVAQQALETFLQGGSGATSQYVFNPQDRVFVASVGPGQSQTVSLFEEIESPGSYGVAVWVEANPIGLIVRDPVNSRVAQPAGALLYTTTLVVS